MIIWHRANIVFPLESHARMFFFIIVGLGAVCRWWLFSFGNTCIGGFNFRSQKYTKIQITISSLKLLNEVARHRQSIQIEACTGFQWIKHLTHRP